MFRPHTIKNVIKTFVVLIYDYLKTSCLYHYMIQESTHSNGSGPKPTFTDFWIVS